MLYMTKNQLLEALDESGLDNSFFEKLPTKIIERMLAAHFLCERIKRIGYAEPEFKNKAQVQADIIIGAAYISSYADEFLEKGISAEAIAAYFLKSMSRYAGGSLPISIARGIVQPLTPQQRGLYFRGVFDTLAIDRPLPSRPKKFTYTRIHCSPPHGAEAV